MTRDEPNTTKPVIINSGNDEPQPQMDENKNEQEDMPSWVKEIQKSMAELKTALTNTAPQPSPSPKAETPAAPIPQPPPPPKPETPAPEPPKRESVFAKAARFLGF